MLKIGDRVVVNATVIENQNGDEVSIRIDRWQGDCPFKGTVEAMVPVKNVRLSRNHARLLRSIGDADLGKFVRRADLT
jgi:hypothetical protein